MISPERLRRYPFFGHLTPAQLREVAMITEDSEIARGAVLFAAGDAARALYLLEDGDIELHYIVVDEHEPQLQKDFIVGRVNPGELLGVSAMIEPHVMTATALVLADSRLLRLDAAGLRALAETDQSLACHLFRQLARVAKERLHYTRVLLAAATAPV